MLMTWPYFFQGILGYKIHFDTNGDAEFNLTLLQFSGKQVICFVFVSKKQRLPIYPVSLAAGVHNVD